MENEFKEAYLNIITEAWDRFDYYDIIKAVKNITNDCKDPWVKGETGSKVLALLKEAGGHTRGRERIKFSSLLDDNDYEIIANDDTYITMYWRGRSKSGSDFDSSAFRSIWSYCSANEYGKSDVVAQEVGKLAYAIWKALNSRNNKIEKNLQTFEEKGFDYQVGQKVENLELNLIGATESSSERSYFGYTYTNPAELICEDPATTFKYKIRLGAKTSRELANLMLKMKSDGNIPQFLSMPEFEALKKVNVSGKIARINKEFKTITLSYATINSPSDDVVKSLFDLYKIKRDEEKRAAEQKRKQKQKEEEQIENDFNLMDLFITNTDVFKQQPELYQEVKNAFNRLMSDENKDNVSFIDKKFLIEKVEPLLQD
jgi:hypothetical protein